MNTRQQDLIEDPPPKCPYFTLPDASNFLTLEDLKNEARCNSSQYNSLIELFGNLNKMSDDQQTQFLLQILKHCAEFKPDFDAVAEALSLSNSTHVSRRFKTILEKQGYQFNSISGQITGDGFLPEDAKASMVLPVIKKATPVKASIAKASPVKKSILRADSKRGMPAESSEMAARKKPKLGLVGIHAGESGLYDSDHDAEFEEDD